MINLTKSVFNKVFYDLQVLFIFYNLRLRNLIRSYVEYITIDLVRYFKIYLQTVIAL